MNPTERTVQLLGLTVPPSQRARFVEEWHADLLGARALGLSPWAIVEAVLRVTLLLGGARVRERLRRRPGRFGLGLVGCVLGFVVVAADVDLEYVTPVVALLLGGRLWTALQSWLRGRP